MSAMIFDLDGTLADSLADIAGSMNAVLERHGFPTHPELAFRNFVGDGVGKLVERTRPPDRAELQDALAAEFRELYAGRLVERTRPYPGVEDALAELAGRGVRLAVLSNKPHAMTEQVIATLFPGVFASVRGVRPPTPRKPDPTAALELAAELEVPPGDCFFVGDTSTDMRTAAAAGMVAVGVLWGFRGRAELEAHGAKHLVETPAELLGLVQED